MVESFAITDCALIALATGETAENLRELRDRLTRIEDMGVIYYHFWGGLLRPHFVDQEYQNNFASWAYHDLHDRRLAERLSIINPAQFDSLEELKQEIIEVIEERMDEEDGAQRAEAEHPFFFMRSLIVEFDTNMRVDTPEELAAKLPDFSLGSLFYHFIDARRRTESRKDDFSEWIKAFGPPYTEVGERIAAIDPYFDSLVELRERVSAIFNYHLNKQER